MIKTGRKKGFRGGMEHHTKETKKREKE